MNWLWLALVGLPAGLALDTVSKRLAQSPQAAGQESHTQAESSATLQTKATAPVQSGSLGRAWARRLLVVALTVGLFATAGARFERVGQLALVTAYISVLVLCAATDVLSFRVPNIVTYPAIIGAMVVGITMPGASIREVLLGGAFSGGALLVPALLTGGVGVGVGDAKLGLFVGVALGLKNAVAALLLTALALLGGRVAASGDGGSPPGRR